MRNLQVERYFLHILYIDIILKLQWYQTKAITLNDLGLIALLGWT